MPMRHPSAAAQKTEAINLPMSQIGGGLLAQLGRSPGPWMPKSARLRDLTASALLRKGNRGKIP
jgi:hypothetical protein